MFCKGDIMEKVKITTEFIKLDQFLKWVGMVGNGSDAKTIIGAGEVKVNGDVELRRGKKLRANDIIEVDGKTFQIE
jgi:ribosome-associated protein